MFFHKAQVKPKDVALLGPIGHVNRPGGSEHDARAKKLCSHPLSILSCSICKSLEAFSLSYDSDLGFMVELRPFCCAFKWLQLDDFSLLVL